MDKNTKLKYRMHLNKACAFIHDEGGRRLASVTDLGGGRTEAENNARLLAAAPQLREQLRLIVTKSYHRTGPHEDCHVHPDLIRQANTLLVETEAK